MLLKLQNISKSYRIAGKPVSVVDGLDLAMSAGDIVSITGKSGCGKTTLLNIIAGITRPDRGSIIFRGKGVHTFLDILNARRRNREIGFIFQTFRLLPQESVASNVLLPARIRGIVTKETRRYMDEVLGKLLIYKYRNTRAALLSGGQKQRVAIARALINRPALILADEPTANLDRDTSIEIFRILENVAGEGTSVLIVTHKDYMHDRSRTVYSMEGGSLKVL